MVLKHWIDLDVFLLDKWGPKKELLLFIILYKILYFYYPIQKGGN